MKRLDTTHQAPAPLDGLLVVDKPAGWSSHDVVAKVRRITGVRRVGHAGTLDPMATGVLPLGLRQGTRVLEYLSDADKAYRGTIRLGTTTTTDDAEGEPVQVSDWRSITDEAVRAVLARFVGPLEQRPPSFSAIKRGGTPLYKLARRGVAVEAPLRHVTISSLNVLSLALPDIEVEVACSKGTYIRSLARDVGVALGCGAHLAALRRLRTGPFTLSQAHTLDDLATAAADGGLPALISTPDAALTVLPAVVVSGEAARRVLTGRDIALPDRPAGSAKIARCYDAVGHFLGLLENVAADQWHPAKMMTSE